MAAFIIVYSTKDWNYEELIEQAIIPDMDVTRLVTMILTHILLQDAIS